MKPEPVKFLAYCGGGFLIGLSGTAINSAAMLVCGLIFVALGFVVEVHQALSKSRNADLLRVHDRVEAWLAGQAEPGPHLRAAMHAAAFVGAGGTKEEAEAILATAEPHHDQ